MNCLATVSRYASLVKFSHTIFALPFALVGYVYALQSNGLPFEWPVLVKVLSAMVLARNTAMGFNRWADRRIDAQNPRTSGREIPSGTISARNALWFVVLNAVLFVLVAWWINPLALALSPVALLVLTGYSLTKRFTAWCHIVLGVALGIAPIGAVSTSFMHCRTWNSIASTDCIPCRLAGESGAVSRSASHSI